MLEVENLLIDRLVEYSDSETSYSVSPSQIIALVFDLIFYRSYLGSRYVVEQRVSALVEVPDVWNHVVDRVHTELVREETHVSAIHVHGIELCVLILVVYEIYLWTESVELIFSRAYDTAHSSIVSSDKTSNYDVRAVVHYLVERDLLLALERDIL